MYTTSFTVTVIGENLFDAIEEFFDAIDISRDISSVEKGMLYNVEAMIYTFEIEYLNIIPTRNLIISFIASETNHITTMFESGNWMNIIISEPIRIVG